MKITTTLSISLFYLVVSFIAFSQDGTLDNSFDSDGKVTYAIADSICAAVDVEVQLDGKIVVGGYQYGQDWLMNFVLLRYNSDGSLDNTFGVNGKLITKFTSIPHSASLSSLAIQDDGKIVGLGKYSDADDDAIAIVRYTVNGSLDNTFGVGGKDTINVLGLTEPKEVKIQADGKILILSYVSGFDIEVIRLNADGSIDNTFDGDGRVVIDPTANMDYPYDMTIQNDGKIVLCGTTSEDIFLVRLNSDGGLDTTFDSDGILTTDHESQIQSATAITVQMDGKIVIGGSHGGWPSQLIVIRYNPDGSLDTSFDTDGILTANFGTESSYLSDVVIQTNGKIVVAGTVDIVGVGALFAIARLNTDGSFDATFDSDGIQTTSFSIDDDYGYALAKQPDGKFVLVGVAETIGGPYADGMAIARYNNSDDLGMKEIETTLHELHVFPNPSNTSVTLQLDHWIGTGEVEIYSVEGQKVCENVSINGDTTTLETLKFPNGKYTVKIVQNGITLAKEELMVNH